MSENEGTPSSAEQATGNAQPQTRDEGQASSESASSSGTTKKTIDLFAKGKTQGEKDALRSVLKDLGVSSLDEVKAVLASLREQPATDEPDPPATASASGATDFAAEVRRLKKDAARRDAERAQLEAKLGATTKQLTDREQQLRSKLAHGAIETAAAQADAWDPGDVRMLIQGRVTLDEDGDVIVLGEDGNPSEMSVADLVGVVRKSKPHLFKASVQSGAGSRAPNGGAGAGGIPKAPTTAAEWEAVLRAAR